MDYRRIRKNVLNRNWEDKTKEQNINYIKRQLKNLGLETPKYLKQGKLTSTNIKANANRIIRALEKAIETNKPALSMDKAMKQLEKVQKKHNSLVYKKLNYVVNKYDLSENQLNYLIGRDVGINGYKSENKFYFRRSNSPFTIENTEGEIYSSPNFIEKRINQIKSKDLHLTNREIDKMMKKNSLTLNNIKSMLDTYITDKQMSKNTANMIMSTLKHMNGLQQEAAYKMLVSSNTKTKYTISDDESEQFQLNLSNKYFSILNEAQKF